MTHETFKKFKWYTYHNGEFTKTFFCIDIDGEYLMFDRRRGYSLIQCKPATEEEIKQAKAEL